MTINSKTSLTKGVWRPADQQAKQDEMFIGWAKTPSVDRRFLLGALPLGLVGLGGVGYGVASNLSDPGAGEWLTNATHQVTGVLARAPYPMIRLADENAPFGMRTVLVVAQGKCTSGLELEAVDGRPVTADGVLIQRKDRQMLEVPLFLDQWLTAAADFVGDVKALAAPVPQSLGAARLKGTVMDSKCFFGVMRPARGVTHKACASLCIRGGIPPSFWARAADGREVVLLMTDAKGNAISNEILPLVADPVEAEGELVRVGDLVQFRADVSAYKRI